jgi:hypothetical protein
MMRDVARDRVGKDKAGDLRTLALKKRDAESGRDKVVVAAFTSAELAKVGDVQAHVENVCIRRRVVNDLNGG